MTQINRTSTIVITIETVGETHQIGVDSSGVVSEIDMLAVMHAMLSGYFNGLNKNGSLEVKEDSVRRVASGERGN